MHGDPSQRHLLERLDIQGSEALCVPPLSGNYGSVDGKRSATVDMCLSWNFRGDFSLRHAVGPNSDDDVLFHPF